MQRVTLQIVFIVAASLCLHSAAFASGSKKGKARTYEITITNLTKRQVIPPPVLATHQSEFSLFEVTGMPSPGLVALAEDAVTDDLVAELEDDPMVGDVVVAGPIPPGTSVTVEISQHGKARYLTVVGMLATTNDGFFASQGIRLPSSKMESVDALVYDAGSEANSESCDHIPGPPCGNPGEAPVEEGEGFIHLHNGIHGIGDLPPERMDWRGPAARIVIQRTR